MARLVLQPTIDEMTTEELERRIESVRARRIVCALEYAASEQMKLEIEQDKAQRKLKEHYKMLGRELERCDRAINACEARVAQIEILRQELDV